MTVVNCPTCEKKVVWNTENVHRPFCSERCKLIDLGEWASEKHTIEGAENREALQFDEFDIPLNDEFFTPE